MRCHLPSLIAPPPMLITYNCPRAGWLLVFPDGDVLVKRFHMILTFPSNRGHHEVSFFVSARNNNIQKIKSNAFGDFQFCNANLKFDFHIWIMSFASIPGHWPSKLLLHSMSRLTTRNLILIFWVTLNLAFWHFCTLCKTLKGDSLQKPEKGIFQSDTLETIRLPGPMRQIRKMLSQIIRLKFILVAQAIYLANWGVWLSCWPY